MIDLETLSMEDFPALAQIGCVRFDIMTGEVQAKLEVKIDPMTCKEIGADFSTKTFEWWMGQPAFKEVIAKALAEGKHLKDAMAMLQDFLAKGRKKDHQVSIWANGIGNDILWLNSYFKKMGTEPFWGYNEPRDVRTIVDVCEQVTGVNVKDEAKKDDSDGALHDGLADSIRQAKYTSKAYNLLLGHRNAA
jgi:hypothetical protein